MTYGSTWVNSSDSGSFSINTEKSGTIGIQLQPKTESFLQNSVFKPLIKGFLN